LNEPTIIGFFYSFLKIPLRKALLVTRRHKGRAAIRFGRAVHLRSKASAGPVCLDTVGAIFIWKISGNMLSLELGSITGLYPKICKVIFTGK
jgi:hypothetical protein